MPLSTLLALFLLGATIGAGFVTGRALAVAAAHAVEAIVHVIRWHVYRPLLRRRYLRRVAAESKRIDDELDRRAAMRRHPAGSAMHPDAHNRALS